MGRHLCPRLSGPVGGAARYTIVRLEARETHALDRFYEGRAMKPLPAANLSDEDCLALVFVTLHRNKSIAALTIRHAMCLESDRRDAELMLNVTCYPYMFGTALAQEMNPNFKMPRPLARIAPRFYGRQL
jgi:hypothetical protein